jgi:hypothetical protein
MTVEIKFSRESLAPSEARIVLLVMDDLGERACLAGGLGQRFPSTDLIPLAFPHMGRLRKFVA